MLIWNDRFPVASTLALKKPPWASSLLRIETARLGRPFAELTGAEMCYSRFSERENIIVKRRGASSQFDTPLVLIWIQ